MSTASSLRGRWRRLALGLPTVLGLKPRGWFIPHRYAPLLPPPGAQPPYPAIERLFEQNEAAFIGVLDAVDAHASQLEASKGLCEQSWFPSLDAAVAYTLVRERKPRHIVEVGSGHSTRVLSRALVDQGGRKLSLRPEFTASVVRAYIEAGESWPLPQRLSYRGPVFRQRERYRQFTQHGVEL